MLKYIIQRLLWAIPTFFASSIIIFVIINLAPGSPIYSDININRNNVNLTNNMVDDLNKYYEFDKPILQRYLTWMGLYPRKIKIATISSKSRGTAQNKTFTIAHSPQQILLKSTKNSILYDVCIYKKDDLEFKLYTGKEFLIAYKSIHGTNQYSISKEKFSGILTGNFGVSYKYSESIFTLIKQRLPISLQFGIALVLFCYVGGIGLGIHKSYKTGQPSDIISSLFLIILYAVPSWILACILLTGFATDFGINIFPFGGTSSSKEIYDAMTIYDKIYDLTIHFILPGLAYSAGGMSTIAFLLKDTINQSLESNFVLIARAKGFTLWQVTLRHALKNALIPIVSRIGHLISIFLAGSYFIEYVFNIEGIGKLTFEAIFARDYPVIFAFAIIYLISTLIGNILSDILLALINPRIKFENS